MEEYYTFSKEFAIAYSCQILKQFKYYCLKGENVIK